MGLKLGKFVCALLVLGNPCSHMSLAFWWETPETLPYHYDYIIFCGIVVVRSSHRRCSVRKGVLRNSAKFTGKHLCQSLFFDKVVGPRAATLLKKRLWHSCFSVNFAEFLRTPFLTEHLWWLLPCKVNSCINVGFLSVSLNLFLSIKICFNIWNSLNCFQQQHFLSQYLLFQSQHSKHQINLLNLFKINDKHTRTMSTT